MNATMRDSICFALGITLLGACTHSPKSYATREEADAASSMIEPPPAPGTTRSKATYPGDPIAQGEADVTGLTPEQIDVMFTAAFEQAKPFAEHTAVCLAMATGDSRWRRDPPAAALRSFATLTSLPVLPASRCAFDVFPYVIEGGERAMLYTVMVEPSERARSITFWAQATYGNLGANGAKFVLRRGVSGWYVDFTGESVIS
jgi:hypothetical protein